MKFTKSLVQQVSDTVQEYTDGVFCLESTGTDLGNGVRYFDKRSSTVWLGSQGAREACAYYIGAALQWARDVGAAEIPGDMLWLKDVQDAYLPQQRYRNWEEQGRETARLYLEVRER